MKHHLMGLFFLGASLTGCAPTLHDVRVAADGASSLYNRIEPALEKQRAVEGDACFQEISAGFSKVETCLDEVRARWKPVREEMEIAYGALVALETAIGAAEAASAARRPVDLGPAFEALAQALDVLQGLGKKAGARGARRPTQEPGTPGATR